MTEHTTGGRRKIYTRTGDGGATSLRDATRVRKDDARLEACGTVDELNAAIGLALATLTRADRPTPALNVDNIKRELETIQQNLCTIQTQILSPSHLANKEPHLAESQIVSLEKSIDRMSLDLPPLNGFILPGGGPVTAKLHLCRTVCRRAERRCVTLAATQDLPGSIIQYLNRLGDYLFTLARWVEYKSGGGEMPWHPSSAS